MSDLDSLLNEMTHTLRDARQAVSDGFEVHRNSTDPDSLWRLAAAAGSFAEQADGLLNMMMKRDPLNPKISEVEDLLDFFHRFEMLIGAAAKATQQ